LSIIWEISKHDFSSLLYRIPSDTRLGFQNQNRNFKISLFLYIRTIIGGFIIVPKKRTYISPIQCQRWNTLIIDCIDSTAYSVFTNPVYVSRTSNHLGTIPLFSRNFLGMPRNVARKQTKSLCRKNRESSRNHEIVYEYVFEACRESYEKTTRSFPVDLRFDLHKRS